MGKNKLLEQARARLQFALLGKIETVEIPEIPTVWEKFMNTEDEWIGFELPESENTTACIYKAKAGSKFGLHRHKEPCEHFVILNKGGSVRVHTETTIENYSYPDAVCFEPNEAHHIDFLTDTKLLVLWHPKMKGWEADFMEKKK